MLGEVKSYLGQGFAYRLFLNCSIPSRARKSMRLKMRMMKRKRGLINFQHTLQNIDGREPIICSTSSQNLKQIIKSQKFEIFLTLRPHKTKIHQWSLEKQQKGLELSFQTYWAWPQGPCLPAFLSLFPFSRQMRFNYIGTGRQTTEEDTAQKD